MKRALITGVTGQDGFYLAKLLLSKGYKVYGMYRRSSLDIRERIGELMPHLNLVEGDVTDGTSIMRIIRDTSPDEIYNLAAQSFVPASWTQPSATVVINAVGTLNILEAIRILNKNIRFYQASSSEMFGKVLETPQKETTPFYPRSPYGVSKVYAYWITRNYRESYGLHASNGILFNHESPKRGKQFVTRKVVHSAVKIKLGFQESFGVGNLNARRDWGDAEDYVEAMWMMLQQEEPGDYVISTGEQHSIRELIEETFKILEMNITWEGVGFDEVGKVNGKIVVRIDPKYFRPAEVDTLLGDSSYARKKLGWFPKTNFKELIRKMVESDYTRMSEHGLQSEDK